MSKIDLPKYSLLTKNFDLIMKIYGVILNHIFYFCYDNFLYFFLKKDLDFFLWLHYGYFRRQYSAKNSAKILL